MCELFLSTRDVRGRGTHASGGDEILRTALWQLLQTATFARGLRVSLLLPTSSIHAARTVPRVNLTAPTICLGRAAATLTFWTPPCFVPRGGANAIYSIGNYLILIIGIFPRNKTFQCQDRLNSEVRREHCNAPCIKDIYGIIAIVERTNE